MADTETTGATAMGDLLEQAFALIAEKGWGRFSRVALARRAGVPLARVYAELPTRAAVLEALGRRADEAMLRVDPAELGDMSPRERVFELVMRRLDALAPFKPGLKALGEKGVRLELLGVGGDNLGRTVGWLLEAAEAGLGPLRQAAAGPALALIYARTFAVWLGDDTPDGAATLAELDKRLGQAEGLARWTAWLDREPPPSRDTAADDGTPDGEAIATPS